MVDARRSDLCARMISAGTDWEGGIDMNECNIWCRYLCGSMNDDGMRRSGQKRKMEDWYKEERKTYSATVAAFLETVLASTTNTTAFASLK